MAQGFNLFRINFAMERLTNTLTSPLNANYLKGLTDVRSLT